MASQDVQSAAPLDTVAARKLIAKVKKGDQDNAEALSAESSAREDADSEIIASLEDETLARQLNDDLLAQQIREASVRSDWDETDTTSQAYIENHPVVLSDAEIMAAFLPS